MSYQQNKRSKWYSKHYDNNTTKWNQPCYRKGLPSNLSTCKIGDLMTKCIYSWPDDKVINIYDLMTKCIHSWPDDKICTFLTCDKVHTYIIHDLMTKYIHSWPDDKIYTFLIWQNTYIHDLMTKSYTSWSNDKVHIYMT